MVEKITQLRKSPKHISYEYHILSEGNTNPILKTFSIANANNVAKHMEEVHRQYLIDSGMLDEPLADRYWVRVVEFSDKK